MSESELFEKIEQLEHRIAELTPRWVRVEDGLPDECKTVRVMLDDKFEDEGFIYSCDKRWYIESIASDAINNKVIAWLKMPDEPEYIHEPIR